MNSYTVMRDLLFKLHCKGCSVLLEMCPFFISIFFLDSLSLYMYRRRVDYASQFTSIDILIVFSSNISVFLSLCSSVYSRMLTCHATCTRHPLHHSHVRSVELRCFIF